ncbi:MAG: FeoA family protein [Oscillospiraceae bacterium]|nr:FeoA family protein [Oscillospiraceae bacterium]MDD4414057.1 FeoA family protein [Oscillospiraceae bacterium]
MVKTLNDLTVGEPAVITELNCKGSVRRRIIDLGLTPGVSVEVLRIAPMGDPLEIRIRGFNMSIRRSEAKKINVVANH